MSEGSTKRRLRAHQTVLSQCRRCPEVVPPVVVGHPAVSRVMLLGQAPGVHEGPRGRPFAHTAGRTLFRWFASIGVDEEAFRERVYMAAVLRCFPGKAARSGGDRVPSREEVARCAHWLHAEIQLLAPSLVIAVGKLAIAQLLQRKSFKLDAVVGPLHRTTFHGRELDWVALPHPSGLSAWPKTEPGKGLLAQALDSLAKHPAFVAATLGTETAPRR